MMHLIYLSKRRLCNKWCLSLLLLWSINGYATLTVSLEFDNCMNPIPNAGTYTNAGTMNGKPYFTKGANLRILWSGTQWEFQGDDPSISGVNWLIGWYNTNDTPFPPQTEWTSSFGCFLPTMSGDETTPLCNLSASSSVTNVSCFVGNNGTATANVTGGTPPYSYSWSPSGGSAATATGLTAGIYTCTITDANSCETTVDATINQPGTALSGNTTVTPVSCFGDNDGAIDLVPSGGTTPYTFDWGGGVTTEDRNNLSGGDYTVTITDNNGCATVISATVTQPSAALSGGTVVSDVSCNGGGNGAINLTPTGGTSPYSFNWGGGITTEDRTGLGAGSYSVIITDANDCMEIVNATVGQPPSFNVTASQTDVDCHGGNNGTATVTVAGGTPGYTYSWSPSGGTGATASGLTAGTYSVSITDANACTTLQNFTINEPDLITGVDIQNICAGSSYTFDGVTYTSANNTATATFTAANGCDSVVTLNLSVTENGVAMTAGSATALQYNDTARFTNGACEMIAVLSSSDDLGSITAMMTILNATPAGGDPYVSRYYDIQTTQPGGGMLTLFYTQQEFDDYNTLVGTDNTDYPQIGANGENLQITAFHSIPGSGDGPGGYDTNAANVEAIPCTAVWNALASRWEVTFTTTQFSGFFLHTKSDGTPLPIKIAELSAKNEGAVNRIDWTSTAEAWGDQFAVERSADGKLFYEIGRLPATGMPGSTYSFRDEMPFSGINYYRLYFLNIDGTGVYSKVVSAHAKGDPGISIGPNPFSTVIYIVIDGPLRDEASITVSDGAGVTIWRSAHILSNKLSIETEEWPAGVYWLHFADGTRSEVLKVVKY